jgi:hypothetical protein
MGMHPMEELFRKWQNGTLTAEQMIGQLMQHMAVLYERLRLVERRLGSFEAQNTERNTQTKQSTLQS